MHEVTIVTATLLPVGVRAGTSARSARRRRFANAAWRGAVTVLLACMACACVETRFESPPGEALASCDARWKGHWIEAGEQPADSGADTTAFDVGDDCAFTLVEQASPAAAPKRTRIPVAYAHVGDADYPVVADDALHGVVDPGPPAGVDAPAPRAWFYVRYRLRGDRATLYTGDSARVARRAIDDAIDANVVRTSGTLHVYVRGTPAQMLEWLRRDPMFDSKPALELRRITDIQSAPAGESHP